MQAVLIAMTILGCDDSVTQCSYIATVDKRWETVATCDAETERQLRLHANASYPTVIAVCEPPKSETRPQAKVAIAPAPSPEAAPRPKPAEGIGSFVARIARQVRSHLPSGEAVKPALAKPVHFVTAGYSWAAARLTN